MTYTMFDHLRIMSEVLTAGTVVLTFGALVVGYKLLVNSKAHKAPLGLAYPAR